MILTDLLTEYGSYINHGQNAQDIMKKAQFGGETASICTLIPTDDTIIRKGSAEMSRVLQPFQKQWSPTGEITVEPSPIQLYKMKVDVEEYPDDLEDSWLGFLASNDTDRTVWPFTRWLIEEYILTQAAEDLELNEVFMGEYLAPPTPGTAGAVSTAMEGLRKILNDLIDGASITPTNTGAIEAVNTDFVGQVEDWFDAAVLDQYKNRPLKIAMRLANFTKYKRGMREKYNMNYDQVGSITLADYENVEIVGLPGWGTSDKILCTPQANLIMGAKRWTQRTLNEMVQAEDRKLKIFADFWRGVGFVRQDLIWTNELDNPV